MAQRNTSAGIGLRTEHGVLWVTLRGSEDDLLGADELVGLRHALRQRGPEVGAVVLTGSDGRFCAGLSLPEGLEAPGATGRWLRDTVNPVLLGLHTLDVPTLAAIDGVAAGVGAALALACDLRFGSQRARFDPQGVDELKVIPGLGWLSVDKAGHRGGAQLGLLGPLDSDEAHRLGLLSDVYAELDQVVRATADRLAAAPFAALRKRGLLRSQELGLRDALDYESRLAEASLGDTVP